MNKRSVIYDILQDSNLIKNEENIEGLAFELSSKLFPDNEIYLVWSMVDVIDIAKDKKDLIISERLAKEVLGFIKRTHDANYGVTWETLDSGIDVVLSYDDTTKGSLTCPVCGLKNNYAVFKIDNVNVECECELEINISVNNIVEKKEEEDE